MTQSEVPGRVKPERGREIRAGALPIGAFEESRWRLRRTRHLWVFNRFGDVWNWRFAAGAGRECIALHRERRHQRAWKLQWDVFCCEWGTLTPAWTHVKPACRSTL
jgi:hypothetical protein